MEFVAVIGRQCSLENRLEATLGRIALIPLVSARDYLPPTQGAAEDPGTLSPP